MAKVEIKQPIVDEIKAKIDGATTVVLVDYRGLTVEQDTKLRKGLREAGCEYKVYKNTLMKRAFEGTDFAQLDDLLDGPSAIAISKEDATAPIRVLNNVAKEAEALEFKGAVVEGTFYDVDGVKALASIPSREELISKLISNASAKLQCCSLSACRTSQKMRDNRRYKNERCHSERYFCFRMNC